MAKDNSDILTNDAPNTRHEGKRPFVAPKLTYIKPTVEKHAIVDVTAGFFGTFYGG